MAPSTLLPNTGDRSSPTRCLAPPRPASSRLVSPRRLPSSRLAASPSPPAVLEAPFYCEHHSGREHRTKPVWTLKSTSKAPFVSGRESGTEPYYRCTQNATGFQAVVPPYCSPHQTGKTAKWATGPLHCVSVLSISLYICMRKYRTYEVCTCHSPVFSSSKPCNVFEEGFTLGGLLDDKPGGGHRCRPFSPPPRGLRPGIVGMRGSMAIQI